MIPTSKEHGPESGRPQDFNELAKMLREEPRREFTILREKFPAIFMFNAQLFQEFYDIDTMEERWIEIAKEDAARWLEKK